MVETISAFLVKMGARLGGIARATKVGLKGTDLVGEVWIAASEIADQRGRSIDFQDLVDQELILAHVYSQIRKQGDWRLHRAVSIDSVSQENLPWSERIADRALTDPLDARENDEALAEQAMLLAASYSQAKAYLVVLANFKSDRPRLCSYLMVSLGVLAYRMSNAAEIVTRQGSLFDGKHVIDSGFMPMAGRRLAIALPCQYGKGAVQGELDF
ncbi:hypothetical protein [Massilia aquatica]|uniref:Uncharacterized protein n=1 Tax=Massilia aquatica TaxID=2609000 RepID=A0ABX0M2V7_9BURK|nr:hypothetical protein [Massilia aquatica]NHZ38865.1 hypothetical protein [Massilia aquatica]